MPNNYKHLYEQMKTVVEMYQDELVPELRKKIKELEQNQIKVRCKDCKHLYNRIGFYRCTHHGGLRKIGEDSYCGYGEKREV